jgi:hypothetical protein
LIKLVDRLSQIRYNSDMMTNNQLPPLPVPKFTETIRGVPCITVTEHEHLMRAYALQARAQVQGDAEATQQAAGRYLWLRDGFHKGDLRKTRRPSDAPYVVNPQKSVLYGIEAYRGQELDRAIDEDRLNDLAQHIYEEALVNGDSRFSEPDFRFSDEFANECFDKARAAMATTPQPAQATQAELTLRFTDHTIAARRTK